MELLEKHRRRVNILLHWLTALQERRLRSKTVTINTNSGITRHILPQWFIPQLCYTASHRNTCRHPQRTDWITVANPHSWVRTTWKGRNHGSGDTGPHSAAHPPTWALSWSWLSKGIETSTWTGDLQWHVHTRMGRKERRREGKGRAMRWDRGKTRQREKNEWSRIWDQIH